MKFIKHIIYTKEADWDKAHSIIIKDIGLGKKGNVTTDYCSKKKHPKENKWVFAIYDNLTKETISKLPVGDNVKELNSSWYSKEEEIIDGKIL